MHEDGRRAGDEQRVVGGLDADNRPGQAGGPVVLPRLDLVAVLEVDEYEVQLGVARELPAVEGVAQPLVDHFLEERVARDDVDLGQVAQRPLQPVVQLAPHLVAEGGRELPVVGHVEHDAQLVGRLRLRVEPSPGGQGGEEQDGDGGQQAGHGSSSARGGAVRGR